MGSARTATASFNRIVGFWHRLDVWTNGQGSGTVKGGDVDCGATCGGRPLDGSTVTLTATPSAWSRFTGWSGCDSASGSTCTLRVTEDRMVVAKFDPVMVSDPTWRVARAGTTNSAAIRADGTLWMWGGNRSGQLGDGTRLNRETPVLVGTGFVDVSLGDYHTLAIKSDGTLWGWGSNQSAQLGDGTVEDRLTPTLVGAGFVAASAPHGRSVALKGDGSLWGWGAFGSSRLHPPYYQQPTLVGPNFQAVSDDGFDCALLVGPMGTLWRWHGSEDAPVSFLSAGGGFVTYELGLGLKADGTLWGIPDTGDPTSISSGVAQASSGKAGDFTFFRWHAMVKSDGTLWSWGSNGGGQLGLGGTSDQATPALVGSGYRSVSAGVLHTLAIKADGTLWAWGENSSGQLGEKANTSVPTAIGAGFTSLAAGSSFSLAVKPQGEIWGNSVPDVLYAWGDNRGRQVSSDANPEDETAPGMSGRVRGISRAAGGEMHTIALKTDGTVWAWGDNAFGQIGNGTTSDPDGEVQVGTGFKAIAAGKWHSAGIKTDGSLWTWGAGESGQLGNGTGTSRSAPGLVGTGFATVACGSNHTLAIKTDGTLWAWGSNLKGQLGDGTTTSRQSPVFVGSGFQSVAAGFAHTVALKTDGTVWTWGDNTYGQIGDGSATPRSTPVLVTSGGRSIASGHHHVLAVKTNGSLVAWGLNASSQLGDGTTTDRAAPVTVGWGFTAMAAGRDHSLGLKADTTLWAWGDNKRAQLSFVRVRVRPGKVQ